MLSILEKVPDFRVEGRCLHKLSDILGLILCGVIADCDDFSEIEDYGKAKESFLQEHLGFEFKNGIPSEDTLNRVMRFIDPVSLSAVYHSCLVDLQSSLLGKQMAIDGKELRGTIPSGKKHALIRMVNVWVCENQISFGQVQTASKSNEIKAIPQLLDMVECSGAIVSIDAMGCQKEIVKKIRDKQADYVITLKENQKGLYTEVKEFMEKRLSQLPFDKTLGKAHGRGEERKVYLSPCLSDFISEAREWTDLNSIAMVERTRIIKGKTEIKRHFYISSLHNVSCEAFAQYVRGHWGIENQLHWQLDVTFGEDASKVRKDNGPINLHLIRKWSLELLKKAQGTMSIKRKRKKAAIDEQFLLSVLIP